MNIKKFGIRFLGLILLLGLLGWAYITLTINRKPVIETASKVETKPTYIIPNTIAQISSNTDELDETTTKALKPLQNSIDLDMQKVETVSVQMSMDKEDVGQTNKNTVLTFTSTEEKETIEKGIQSSSSFVKETEENGQNYYRSKNNTKEVYFFPDDQTMVITKDRTIVDKVVVDGNLAPAINSSNGISFNFDKDDPNLEHFLSNIPEYLVDRFQGIGGILASDENTNSHIEIKMESAFYARALEMALPKVINQLKNKVIKVDGKFIVSGSNVVLSKEELNSLDEMIDSIEIKSSRKSANIILKGEEKTAYLLNIITNVMING